MTIDSQSDEIVMHDFAIANKQQLWIGLYSVQVQTTDKITSGKIINIFLLIN